MPGASFYICRTEIKSGFDGYLPEPEESGDRMIEAAVQKLANQSAENLMDDVYQEIKLVLCPSCRLKLRDRIFSMVQKK